MWYKIQDGQVVLPIFAKPNAKKTAVLGLSDQGLLIALHAKPHQGAANDALIAYVAEWLQIPKSKIIVQRGQRSRYKQLQLPLTDRLQAVLAAIPALTRE